MANRSLRSGSKTRLARPFYYKRGSIGILLVHGFTGTPYVFREIGRKLARDGYTVSAPLIAGHGTKPSDLEQTTWQDWYHSVERAYVKLAKDCEAVVVVGASFGSNLCCYLASTPRPKLKGLVLIGIPRWIYRHTLARLFTIIFRLVGIRNYHKAIRKEVADGSMLGGPNYSYLSIPISSVQQFLHFVSRVTEGVLDRIKAPTLIIQSTTDGLVKPASGTFVYNKISSSHKELIWIQEPHHELHKGKNSHHIYSLITDFMVRWK